MTIPQNNCQMTSSTDQFISNVRHQMWLFWLSAGIIYKRVIIYLFSIGIRARKYFMIGLEIKFLKMGNRRNRKKAYLFVARLAHRFECFLKNIIKDRFNNNNIITITIDKSNRTPSLQTSVAIHSIFLKSKTRWHQMKEPQVLATDTQRFN